MERRSGLSGQASRAFRALAAASVALGALAPLRGEDEGGADPLIHFTVTGEGLGDNLGWGLAGTGDLDGDGVPDLAVSVLRRRLNTDGHPAPGEVLIVSGADGSTIRTLTGRGEEGWQYGRSLASGGDIDGDGVQDLLIQARQAIDVRSGKTGDYIRTHEDRNLISHVARLAITGDVDGDGRDDYAMSLPREQDFSLPQRPSSANGRVTVCSGRTGEELWTRRGEGPADALGVSIAVLGDIDGDRVGDLAVGAPGNLRQPAPVPPRPTVHVLSGADGREIYRLHAGELEDGFGVELAALGDVDGDGAGDFAAGLPGFPIGEFHGAGRVDVYSGREGRLLWSVNGQDFDRLPLGSFFGGDGLGGSLARAGDADGDGAQDVLITAGRPGMRNQDWSRVYVRSGRTGELLAAYESERDDSYFGARLAAVGDIDGDGRSEFAIGAPEWDLPPTAWFGDGDEAGRVYVMSYRAAGIPFIRGDADLDGRVNLTDAVVILRHLFQGAPAPCLEAMDIDRYRGLGVTLSDAILLLTHIYLAGVAPQPPYPDCGRFATPRERLPCERSACE